MGGSQDQDENLEQARSATRGVRPDAAASRGFSSVETIALAASVLWIIGAAVFLFTMYTSDAGAEQSSAFLEISMLLLGIVVPVALIWVAAISARSARVMREESQRLRVAIDGIRHAYVTQSQRGSGTDSVVTRKLDEVIGAQRKIETALLTFTSIRDASVERGDTIAPKVERATDADQAPLPLEGPEVSIQPALSREDFIRALNFPETAEDEAGFAALRKALKDRHSALLIQASQDILTLLSQDGIYMDDLRPDMAGSDIWRRFAKGERGRQVAALGGIHDRSSLALTAGRMRQDPIFRDVAHHFLRRFDRMFVEFEESATDQEIQALADTRTARAFMLLGRVAGTFD